jgi:hypothetical protein
MKELLSPRAHEQQKSAKEKSDDWSYTLSHMATCIATDPFTPFISAFFQQKITGKANTLEHLEGEFFGDVVAVPVTVAIQRFAPEITAGLRNIIEPIAGGAYQKSATQSAESWAHREHVSEDSPEFYAYQRQQYEYEMSRIPLQLIWTVTSVLANVAAQKTIFPNDEKTSDILWSVTGGAVVTLGLQNLGRIFIPEAMHAVDGFASDHIVTPITKIFTREGAQEEGKVVMDELRLQY